MPVPVTRRWCRYLPIALAVLVPASACGDSDTTPQAPEISDLTLTPTTVTAGTQPQIDGTVDFYDANGDAGKFVIKVTTPSQTSQQTDPTAAAEADGQKSGTLGFRITINAAASGPYLVEIWMLDDHGLTSNRLRGVVTAQ